MASNICPCLLNEVWRSYANDLDNVPETEGIYAIGDASGNVVYVGHSHNMRMRLGEHKSGPQAIDQFVKEFERNGGDKPEDKMGRGSPSPMCGRRVP